MTKVPIIKIVHGYYPEQKLSRISALPQLNTKGRWVYGGIVNFKSAGRMFKMLLRLVVLKLGEMAISKFTCSLGDAVRIVLGCMYNILNVSLSRESTTSPM